MFFYLDTSTCVLSTVRLPQLYSVTHLPSSAYYCQNTKSRSRLANVKRKQLIFWLLDGLNLSQTVLPMDWASSVLAVGSKCCVKLDTKPPFCSATFASHTTSVFRQKSLAFVIKIIWNWSDWNTRSVVFML